MAVQKHKVTRSKRDKRRTHDSLTGVSLSTDSVTGEKHRRHHVSDDGFYKGKKVLEIKEKYSEEEIEE